MTNCVFFSVTVVASVMKLLHSSVQLVTVSVVGAVTTKVVPWWVNVVGDGQYVVNCEMTVVTVVGCAVTFV